MPNINNDILVWARETAKMTVEFAAQKLQIKGSQVSSACDKLLAYETGEKAPSRSLLKNMAKVYHRPLLTFYLDSPPRIGDRGQDFRTLPHDIDPQENVFVDTMIRNLKARQSTVRETLILEDESDILDFVGCIDEGRGVNCVTEKLREILDLSLGDFRGQSSVENAFKLLRQRVEAIGVFVILKGNLGSHHTNIDVTVFRGFALADTIAPFIVINDRDAKTAWSFTLLHEMAHLLLGQTGVSGLRAEKSVEKFCNDVASEVLLPTNEFDSFAPIQSDFERLANQISEYAYALKISSAHVAYRLFKRGDIARPRWEKLRTYYREQWFNQREILRAKNQEQQGGPNYYLVRRHKLGSLVELVKRFTYSGALSTTKAGMLLDVKPLKVHRLFETGRVA